MTHMLYKGDSIDHLPKIETGSVRLVLTDPPFNTGLTRIK